MIRNLGFAWKACALITLLGAAGCSSDSPVDIGDGKKRGEALSDYVAVWDGYAEAYEFLDGSDRVRIALDDDGNGFLEVGDSPNPDQESTSGGPPPTVFISPALSPGYVYPIVVASVEGTRLRLGATYPSLGPWCEAQPPVLYDPDNTPGLYSCYPLIEGFENGMGSYQQDEENGICWVTDSSEAFPCRVPFYCWQACGCTADGCQLASTETPAVITYGQVPELTLENSMIRMDGALNDGGDMLTGTLVSDSGHRLTVRLQRQ